eukprot:TRINITY_DN18908_c0_g1_i1.p1 TRINITY_DN18908_c0_g1~~TRINITY_DN18908_c0_g1_i1.p1  ORF type:complete len:207 (+),score=15.82 TRINITY_DN18908_c0_g1_i1:1-621(+)
MGAEKHPADVPGLYYKGVLLNADRSKHHPQCPCEACVAFSGKSSLNDSPLSDSDQSSDPDADDGDSGSGDRSSSSTMTESGSRSGSGIRRGKGKGRGTRGQGRGKAKGPVGEAVPAMSRREMLAQARELAERHRRAEDAEHEPPEMVRAQRAQQAVSAARPEVGRKKEQKSGFVQHLKRNMCWYVAIIALITIIIAIVAISVGRSG